MAYAIKKAYLRVPAIKKAYAQPINKKKEKKFSYFDYVKRQKLEEKGYLYNILLNEKLKYPDLPFINLTDDDNVIICNFIKDIVWGPP